MALRLLLPGLLLTVLLVSAGRTEPGMAQSRPQIPENGDLVVGLTLSGGGAAGLAHIGVLKVLEEAGIPVDVVTGTSMGAIIGGLYALGYSAEQLEIEVGAIDWREFFEESIHRVHLPMEEKAQDGVFLISLPIDGRKVLFPTGLVSGNHIFNYLANLTWPWHHIEDFRALPRPFLCVATDLETGDPVILDRGFLPDALRASMSIPSVFDPVWIDERYLVDGGVVNNLPVEQAFELGATFVIAINSSSDLRPVKDLLSLPDILTQTIAVGMRQTMHTQANLSHVYIQPDLSHYTTLSFANAAEIIQAGETAARERMDEWLALAEYLNSRRDTTRAALSDPPEPSSLLNIGRITLEGLETVPPDHIFTKIQIDEFTEVEKQELSEALMRLSGMKRFKRVLYKLHPSGEYHDLTFHFEEQTANLVQLGIHHYNITGPSLLFNATMRNLLYPASSARLNVRLGHENMAEISYFNYIGLDPRMAFDGVVGFIEQENDWYVGNQRETTLQTDRFYAEGQLGPLYASIVRVGLGYRIEHYRISRTYGPLQTPDGWRSLHMFTGNLEFDNLDRTWYPQAGRQLKVRAEWAPAFLPGEGNPGRIQTSVSSYLTILPRFTLSHTLRAGYTFGGDLPVHYEFFSGGHNTFWGLPKDALAGKNLVTARFAGRYRISSNVHGTAGFNIGNSFDRLERSVFAAQPVGGWGTALGWNTFIGPIEVILSGSPSHALLFEFRVGTNF